MYKDILKGFKMQNFEVKKTLTGTLRKMKVGKTIRIKNKDFRITSAYSSKNRLKREGIIIDISQKGLIDEYDVTRLA